MAVGGLSERLAFILELDADGALSGFRRVGDTAERELGKADNRLDRLGGRMQVAGAGALAFAGVAGRALFSFAEQSEDANLAQLKLQNSLSNNPRLAGENAAAFTDLAQAIQGKTAADGDAIVAGMAMLGTFAVTGDQMRELTPLVVDYARKFGTDLVTANASVGKALDGSVGALKRNGVSIDETLFKTDRFRAVTEALASQVGGFAESEGATLSGRLQRLKNEFGDLAEGVGAGAVDAFEIMIGPVTALSDKLGELDPGIQATAGRIATYGTVAVGAVGATSFLAGSVVRARDNFKAFSEMSSTLSGRVGSLPVAFAGAAAGIGVAAGLLTIYTQKQRAAADAARELADAAKSTGKTIEEVAIEKLAKQLGESDKVARAMEATGVSFDELGQHMRESKADFEAWNDSMMKADVQVGASGRQYSELSGRVGAARKTMEAAQDVADRTAAAQRGLAVSSGDAASGADGLADSTQNVTDRLKKQKDALDAVLDATLAQFDSNLGYRKSIDAVEGALQELADTERVAGRNSEAYRDVLLSTEGALTSQADAAVKLADDQAKANGKTLDAADKAKIWREELGRLADGLAPGSPLRVQLQGYVDQLAKVPTSITTSLKGDFALFGSRRVPVRAAGGDIPPGGVIVGESGPEIVERDAGGGLKVTDAQRTRTAGGSTRSQTVNIHLHGSTVTAQDLAREAIWQWRVAG